MEMPTMRQAFLAAVLAASGAAIAAGPGMQAPGERAAGEPIFGSDLMTEEEREAYRDRLGRAGSAEEVERIRGEHHERMRRRAAEHGVRLPEEPRERGSRMRHGEGGVGLRDRDGGRAGR